MAIRMQQRRGTAEQWELANPVLAAGEIGLETDYNKFKIGDGISHWDDLPYFLDENGFGGSLDDYVPLSTVGQALGVASLDSSGQVPLSQLGNAPDPDLSAYATTQYVDDAIEGVVGLAPEQLNTLSEIADALGDNANFFSDIATDISDAEAAAVATANAYTDNAISAIPPVDLTGYATEAYVDDAISDIPPVDLTGYATESYVNTAIENVVGLAPEDLNTLSELADALGDNPAAITTLQSDVADLQADKADTNSPTFTGLTDFQGIVDFSDAVVVGIDALPDQAGNEGKYLTTDGTTASWQTVASPTPHPFTMIG